MILWQSRKSVIGKGEDTATPLTLGKKNDTAVTEKGFGGLEGRLALSTLEEDLAILCEKAKQYGASKATIISADRIVVDPRVRLKCMIPLCASYGVNLMCPPNVISPEEFAKILSLYRHAILVQVPLTINNDFVKILGQGKSLSEIREDQNYRNLLSKGDRQLIEILCKLEKDCLEMGYRFATGLSAGTCRLCEECVGQHSGKPCRHPFVARPSMEAVGIDVIQTAKNAGIDLKFFAKTTPVWLGLLLVD
ncbi:MAG: DUF2284 domain-containing protein [Methanomassiliicoccales archaeon]|nr:DUF2284 domain-containing protein [Methanomassiliicoccales archaeon]